MGTYGGWEEVLTLARCSWETFGLRNRGSSCQRRVAVCPCMARPSFATSLLTLAQERFIEVQHLRCSGHATAGLTS